MPVARAGGEDSLMSADAQADTLDADFPTRRILAIVGDKWTTVVLYCLSTREHRRFNELQRQIPDISKKMLIQTLRNLERDGVWSAPSISKCRRKPSTGSRIVVTNSGSRSLGFASGAWIIASSLMVSLRPGQGLFIKADQTDRQDQSGTIDGLFSSALSFSVRISENRPIIPIAAEPEQILRIAKSGVDQTHRSASSVAMRKPLRFNAIRRHRRSPGE
jgi:hypothetical protein